MLVLFVFRVVFGARERPTGRKSLAIGIDLGTTFSCVGVFENSRVEIIASQSGSHITPSVVSFRDKKKLFGEAAQEQRVLNPENTIFSIKRLIGLRYSDSKLQAELNHLPYKVISKNDHPFVQVKVKEEKIRFSPEEISAMILSYEKRIADEFLGFDVKNAVVTVPAYFNDGQRKATMDAGKIAGLNVLHILNEPTAACIAYGFDKDTGNKRTLLVFDLGGGTFDVSIVIVHNGNFEVVAVNGDTHLGGEDFDTRIVNYLKSLFKSKTGKDVSNNHKALAKLRRAATTAKIALSQQLQAEISIENLHDNEDFETVITRSKFEDLCMNLFEKTMDPLEKVLKDAQLRPNEIDEVVLVGGSTRIPKVQYLVRKFFDGKEPAKNINPDEAVAYGAALYAANLAGDEKVGDMKLFEVSPLSLGIQVVGGFMSVIIPRNTRIPVVRMRNHTTTADYQTSTRIPVYEGEHPLTRDNHCLGGFRLPHIQKALRGVPSVAVTFAIDENGVLVVTARDWKTKSTNTITLKWNDVRLSGEELREAIRKAEQTRQEDEKVRRSIKAMAELENYLRQVLIDMNAGTTRVNQRDKSLVAAIVDEGRSWCDAHRHEAVKVIRKKFKEFQTRLEPLLKSNSGHGNPGGDDHGL
jgi:molecular chaperone DnaK (HSP70)